MSDHAAPAALAATLERELEEELLGRSDVDSTRQGQLRADPMHPEHHGAALHSLDLGLLIQRLDEGSARVHIDIHTDDLAAEIARLEELRAERVQQAHSWQVMRDPAGLMFCVIPESPGTLNDGNAHRWD